MRIQYLSDVHVEFHADAGAAFVASLDPADIDVLVVAGDFAVAEGIGPALDLICARYADARVIYVHGNHEFYGSSRAAVLAMTRATAKRNSNLCWLDGDIVEIAGVRFVGAPLWFREPVGAKHLTRLMNDFVQIREFASWVYEENERAIAFFDDELRAGDVVVTHYLPAEACIATRWKGDALNPFFVCDLESLIRNRSPAIWIHGHTHDSVDVTVGETRIVANPFGYVRHELNRAFLDKAVIELVSSSKRTRGPRDP